MDIAWCDKYIEYPDEFPRPDWTSIAKAIEQDVERAQWHEAWHDVSRKWLQETACVLGEEYHIEESDHFFLLTDETRSYTDVLLCFLEDALHSIMSSLPGIAQTAKHGKHSIMMFDSQERYYHYIAYFYPDVGSFASSGGIFIKSGYGHFVFPQSELGEVERIAAHELTHACLMHLPLPLWLNEGIAGNMEDLLTHSAPFVCSHEFIERHQCFWRKNRIQQFWSGASFFQPDEGHELSYHLARLVTKILSHDYPTFRQFVLTVNAEDGGESAVQQHFGGSLGDVIVQILGNGEWTPKSTSWEKNERRSQADRSSTQGEDSTKTRQRIRHNSRSKRKGTPSKKRIRAIAKHGWGERIANIITVIIFGAILIFFTTLLPSEPFEERGKYEGKLLGLYQAQTRYGAPTQFLVTLNTGTVVKVNASKMGTFKKGREVIVQEWRSKWFRRTRYVFVMYIEPSDGIKTIPLSE